MSRTYRHNPADDWDDHARRKTNRSRKTRPIGDGRTYRVTSKRRDEIDYDKFVAAMARHVIAQAEADAEEHDDDPDAAESGGGDE